MLPRRRKKTRAFKTSRCVVRGCRRPQIMDERCKSHANQEAWRVLSLQVRSIGRCEFAGLDKVTCGGGLQAAHIYPKGAYPRIKFDRDNLISLCAGHHRYYTERWPDWRLMALRHLGQERFDALWSRSGASDASGLLPSPPEPSQSLTGQTKRGPARTESDPSGAA